MKIKRRHLKYLIERYLAEEDKKEDEKPEEESVAVKAPEGDTEKKTIGNQAREVYNASQKKDNKGKSIEIPEKLAKVLDLDVDDDESPGVKKPASEIEDLYKNKNNVLRPYLTT